VSFSERVAVTYRCDGEPDSDEIVFPQRCDDHRVGCALGSVVPSEQQRFGRPEAGHFDWSPLAMPQRRENQTPLSSSQRKSIVVKRNEGRTVSSRWLPPSAETLAAENAKPCWIQGACRPPCYWPYRQRKDSLLSLATPFQWFQLVAFAAIMRRNRDFALVSTGLCWRNNSH